MHFRCAFKNTPKYNEVLGKGKIVKRSWIEDSFNQRKYLPWRRYALVSEEALKGESEEEICEEANSESDQNKGTENGITFILSQHFQYNFLIIKNFLPFSCT